MHVVRLALRSLTAMKSAGLVARMGEQPRYGARARSRVEDELARPTVWPAREEAVRTPGCCPRAAMANTGRTW